MNTVMLIRHAEKPRPDIGTGGVDIFGRSGAENLSVRGWQRAGALVHMFCRPPVAGIERPRHLFAPRITAMSPSARGPQTLAPLSEVLGIPVNTDCEKDDVEGLVCIVRRCSEPVLVAWQHKAIVPLANALLDSTTRSPQRWPDDCFDVVWSFEIAETEVRFHEIPQMLLSGDRGGLQELAR
jgi:broad specificity phosphatase PhoE